MGFCPIWGIWRGAGTPATSQMRCWLLPNGRIFPAAAGLLCVLNPRFSALPARRRNVGFSRCAAHTLAVGAESRTQRRHAAHGGERCPLWKGARMQTVQGVTPLPSCSGKRQSHWSARRSERMPRFRFAIFSVRSEMPSCFASARTSSAGLVCVRNLRSSSSICMVFVCTCPVPFRMLSTVASQKPFHRKPCSG